MSTHIDTRPIAIDTKPTGVSDTIPAFDKVI